MDEVAAGIDLPTSMAFLGIGDILVTEKNTGKVMKIMNGTVIQDPVLDVNVANSLERGMLGIAAIKEQEYDKIKVFVYFT